MGRALPEPKPATTAEQRQIIAGCSVSKTEGMRTIYDVRAADGRYLGQVRTTFGGQFFRPDPTEEFLYAGGEWSSIIDPPHCLGILELINHHASVTA